MPDLVPSSDEESDEDEAVQERRTKDRRTEDRRTGKTGKALTNDGGAQGRSSTSTRHGGEHNQRDRYAI